ncbi:type II toxin-antitoxin system HipA family toxin [Adlercreutzia sp. ZJ154]|uniref:type II toxin-antitoxin system HipA family toxin n=1 Tax=Adlercreutzia sp. ZJ154 TaxID=2709790 RepID=UPI0013EAC58F|nr:type II toxin-antitoxin system HipA family toxin [Adlercreutzia sp. ZJ154]
MRDVISKIQDLRKLSWTERATSSGTAGCFLKAREETGAGAWFYKLSCYDSYRGIYGHECVNELIASRLMELLGIPHLQYRLVHALVNVDGAQYETWLNRSRNYRASDERKLALDAFYDLTKKHGESPLELCDRYGWGEQIRQMMLVDFLIANRDRHGANIEVLRSANGNMRLAPIFDSGLSLVFSCYNDEDKVAAVDPLNDVDANNFIGTRSLQENITRFASSIKPPNTLTQQGKTFLFKGLNSAISQTHVDKIWEIIWTRWCWYAQI